MSRFRLFTHPRMLALALLHPALASAQQGIRPGDRVRFASPELGQRIVGTVMSRTADSIRIAVPDPSARRDTLRAALLSFPIATLPPLYVSQGKSRAKGAERGFWAGAALGVVLAGIIMYDVTHNPTEGAEIGAVIALAAPPVLALAGSAVGFLLGTEKWEREAP